MAERKTVDWDSIEREFRAGQLSIREIARQSSVTEGAIRKRAKADGWKRDLTKRVREAVRSELVRDAVRDESARTDERAIVTAAAARNVEVVHCHRRDIAALRERRARLMALYDKLIDGPGLPTLKDAEAAASILESVSRMDSRIVQMERQAFSLDDKATASGTATFIIEE